MSACSDNNAVLMVKAGLHWSFRISCHTYGKVASEKTNMTKKKRRNAGKPSKIQKRPRKESRGTHQTNCACLRRYIRMPNLGHELHLGWFERILLGDCNVNFENTSFVDRSRGPIDGPHQMPEISFGLGLGVHPRRIILSHLRQLLHQTTVRRRHRGARRMCKCCCCCLHKQRFNNDEETARLPLVRAG